MPWKVEVQYYEEVQKVILMAGMQYLKGFWFSNGADKWLHNLKFNLDNCGFEHRREEVTNY